MIDLEVGRYALRTFRPVASEEERDCDPWMVWRNVGFFARTEPIIEMASVSLRGANWKKGECRAKCHWERMIPAWNGWGPGQEPSKHSAPNEGCRCGVYGSLSLDWLENQYGFFTAINVAVIAVEGQTLIGPRGLRCEYARVVAYWCQQTLLDVCGQQFVGAQNYKNTDEMLRAYDLPRHEEVPRGKEIAKI